MRSADPEIARQIEAADDERFRAKAACDWPALERLLADELVYVHVSARTDTKDSLLESLRSGRVQYLRGTRRDVNIRAYRDIALMNGAVKIEFQIDNVPRSSESAFVSAWVDRDGRWQMVHWHSTSITAS
jgi:hypothetical protein